MNFLRNAQLATSVTKGAQFPAVLYVHKITSCSPGIPRRSLCNLPLSHKCRSSLTNKPQKLQSAKHLNLHVPTTGAPGDKIPSPKCCTQTQTCTQIHITSDKTPLTPNPLPLGNWELTYTTVREQDTLPLLRLHLSVLCLKIATQDSWDSST